MVNKTLGKIPPQAIEIEEAVLGSLMIDSDAIHKISGIITSSESFYKDSHRIIYDTIREISIKNKPIDIITVTKSLRDKGKLEQVGGALTITQLTGNIVSAAHIEHHARIIQQLFIQRELIKIGTETVSDAFDESADIDDIISNLKEKISTLEDFGFGTNFGQEQKEVLKQSIAEIERDCMEVRKGVQPGITTGLYELNKATGGWRTANFIIIASRPGVGKTSLALHFAKMAAKSGKWVNFYGLEMTAPDLMRIEISGESEVNRSAIRDGYVSDEQWTEINKVIPSLEKLPIIWSDFAGITADKIRTQTIRNKKRNCCDMVIIDYLQLIMPSDKKSNREQQIADISRTLKRLALSENVPVIALAQLNREAENVKPQLGHLRESGSLEQDADVVIFPWKEDDKYQLTIAKNRRGKKGTFEIFANEEMTSFGDLNPFGNDSIAGSYQMGVNDKF